MLVVFKSRACGNLSMFGDVAVKLLKLMGRRGEAPGAILPEDIPQALKQLREGVANLDDDVEVDEADEDEAVEFIDEPVNLRTRALPLIEMLETSVAEDVPVMWEEHS